MATAICNSLTFPSRQRIPCDTSPEFQHFLFKGFFISLKLLHIFCLQDKGYSCRQKYWLSCINDWHANALLLSSTTITYNSSEKFARWCSPPYHGSITCDNLSTFTIRPSLKSSLPLDPFTADLLALWKLPVLPREDLREVHVTQFRVQLGVFCPFLHEEPQISREGLFWEIRVFLREGEKKKKYILDYWETNLGKTRFLITLLYYLSPPASLGVSDEVFSVDNHLRQSTIFAYLNHRVQSHTSQQSNKRGISYTVWGIHHKTKSVKTSYKKSSLLTSKQNIFRDPV